MKNIVQITRDIDSTCFLLDNKGSIHYFGINTNDTEFDREEEYKVHLITLDIKEIIEISCIGILRLFAMNSRKQIYDLELTSGGDISNMTIIEIP